MSNLNENVDSEITSDPWRRKATTTARYDLCSKCQFFTPQKPYQPGIRCIFNLRPDVVFEDDGAIGKCEVFKEAAASGPLRLASSEASEPRPQSGREKKIDNL